MNGQAFTFFIERLENGAWIVGWREGSDDYGRIPPNRVGFATYAEAEKYALERMKVLYRKKRDEWEKAALDAAKAQALSSKA